MKSINVRVSEEASKSMLVNNQIDITMYAKMNTISLEEAKKRHPLNPNTESKISEPKK